MRFLKLQNMVFVLLTAVMLAVCSCRQSEDSDAKTSSHSKRPNIIVLTVDTLRVDHIGRYGYRRNTMPAIEKIAETAVVFDNAIVPRGSTRTSYASILTGLYPFGHGVYTNHVVLHDKLINHPKIFRSEGYLNADFVSNYVLVGEISGCNQGFDIYDDFMDDREATRKNYERIAEKTAQAILEWLGTDPPQPFFLFTNFIDPHGPYLPPERFGNLYQSEKKLMLNKTGAKVVRSQIVDNSMNYYDYVDRYDEEIRYVDEAMGLVIEQLKLKGLWDDALVIFTADHGEAFGEHEWFFDHHHGLWEATTRVPLMIRLGSSDNQKRDNTRRTGSISSPMDLMPTILDYLDISFEGKMDGQSLVEILKGKENTDRMFFLELPGISAPHAKEPWPDTYAVRTPTHKLIRVFDPDTGKLKDQTVFDIIKDPMEQKGLQFDKSLKTHRQMARYLDAALTQVHEYELPFTLTSYQMPFSQRKDFVQGRKEQRKMIYKQFSEEQVEKLRGLGYVE